MPTVVFTGWKYGLKKVQLDLAIMRRTGMGLASSKDVVDRVLAGEVIRVQVVSHEEAESLVSEAIASNAECYVERLPSC